MSRRAGWASADVLPGWREIAAKQSILEFIGAVTDPGSADFVPEPDRIAVFDNDGTLWTERPVYAQLVFALDRAAELGHPTSLEELRAGGMDALIKLLGLTHAGITTGEFDAACGAGWPQPATRGSGAPTRRSSTSRCWGCWTATASPAGSSLAVARTSCERGQPMSTACRPTG
jgi:hypothetical protein